VSGVRRTEVLTQVRHVRRLLGQLRLSDRKRRILMAQRNRDSADMTAGDGENHRGDRWPCVIQLGVGVLAVAILAVVIVGAVLNTTEGI